MDCKTYQDLVAADVDGQLSADEAVSAKAHVAGCVRCARLRREQEGMRDLLRERVSRSPLPDALKERVWDGLPEEISAPPVGTSTTRRLVLAGAVAAVLFLSVVLPRYWETGPDLLAVLVRDVHAATGDQIELTQANQIEILRQFYNGSGKFSFENTTVDLTALGFRPIGGAIIPIGDVPATFTVYESQHGKLICRRFAVGALPLPEGGKELDGAQLFTVEGITIRIVRDGDAICCFASDMPYDTLMAYLDRARHH